MFACSETALGQLNMTMLPGLTLNVLSQMRFELSPANTCRSLSTHSLTPGVRPATSPFFTLSQWPCLFLYWEKLKQSEDKFPKNLILKNLPKLPTSPHSYLVLLLILLLRYYLDELSMLQCHTFHSVDPILLSCWRILLKQFFSLSWSISDYHKNMLLFHAS